MLAARSVMKKLALIFVIAACSKKQQPPPFKGPLTVDVIMSAKDVVKPFDEWTDGYGRVQAKVGAPTKIDGTKYWWAAMDGDTCAYMMIEQDDGKKFHKDGPMVGMVQDPGKYAKGDAMMNRAECLELLGKGPNPEDPNAPGPAETNQVKDVLTNAAKGRSKWDGKTIKVAGNVTQSGSLVRLADASDDQQAVSAHMKDGATAPEVGKPATLTCTVKIEKWVKGTGEESLEAELDDCTP